MFTIKELYKNVSGWKKINASNLNNEDELDGLVFIMKSGRKFKLKEILKEGVDKPIQNV